MSVRVFVCMGRAQQAETSWGCKKWVIEGEGREKERARDQGGESAAHGKHMYYMIAGSIEMHIWMDGGEGADDVGLERGGERKACEEKTGWPS